MNMKIGTEAAQFPEKEYMNAISLQCVGQIYQNVSIYIRNCSASMHVSMEVQFMCCTSAAHHPHEYVVSVALFTLHTPDP
jgi:hypothetical protein